VGRQSGQRGISKICYGINFRECTLLILISSLWDKDVESDTASHRFSYTIGVIGMHPKASRLARTFSYPTVVFNLHEQFARLRSRGKFETMKQTIRAREMTFQGSINPMLSNFGENSEARQYSGRAVSDNWTCPFHVQKKSGNI
jgi:FPC/CPF motif-containing protein YcgG